MSKQDDKKSISEINRFNIAVSNGLKKNNSTGHILKFLNGEIIQRSKNDCPDIAKWCFRGKSKEKILVGIEHFEIDQFSKKKKDGYTSIGREISNIQSKIFEKGHEELINSGDVSNYNKEKLLDSISDLVKETVISSYNTFIEAFRYHLTHHVKKYDIYVKNLKNISSDCKIELALFLDIRTAFQSYFYYDGIDYRKNKNGLSPVFEDIVVELEKIDQKKFKYIVLMMSNNTPLSNAIEVIALRTGNIRLQLKNQHIDIFNYFGEDMEDHSKIEKAEITRINKDDGNYMLKTSVTMPSGDYQLERLALPVKRSIEAVKSGSKFVTTISVMYYLVPLWGLLKFKKISPGKYSMEIVDGVSKLEILNRLNDFKNKYGIKE